MRKFALFLIAGLLVSFTVFSESMENEKKVYQTVARAINQDNFSLLRSYLLLQPGLSFDNLRKNWDRAKPSFQKMFPPYEVITILKTVSDKNGHQYWIVEFNKVNQGSKQIKCYRFTPNSSNKMGRKIAITKYVGSYTFPDQFKTREWVIKDIIKKIKSEL